MWTLEHADLCVGEREVLDRLQLTASSEFYIPQITTAVKCFLFYALYTSCNRHTFDTAVVEPAFFDIDDSFWNDQIHLRAIVSKSIINDVCL